MTNETRELLRQVANLDERKDIWLHSDTVSEFVKESVEQVFTENRMKLTFANGEYMELIIEGDMCNGCYWKVYSYKSYKYSKKVHTNFKTAMFVEKDNGWYVFK